MRFTVPQFIDYESKIFGPFTFNQFLSMAGAGGICFALYFMVPFSIFLAVCVIVIGGALGFAFVKVNGKPLTSVLTSFLKFFLTPKMFIWKKKETYTTTIKKGERTLVGTEPDKDNPLKIVEGSQIDQLKNQIETSKKEE